MSGCLQLKKSNCKNCYKCIRSCPVKSIRFSDNQAHIIEDECILCGRCFVNCPQNAKEIRSDVHVAKRLIAEGTPVYVSVAPSYIANYPGVHMDMMEAALQKLGFAAAEETAIGAQIVKREYEKMVAGRQQKVIISSCCHSVNTLIQKQYPVALKYLAHIQSPMLAHCQKLKEDHPGCYTVFVGPCISKKDEADKYAGIVDCVLTFEELSLWMDEEHVTFEETPDSRERGRSRLFPVTGGILRSMDKEKDFAYMAIDGVEECMAALEDIENGKIEDCFIEMSACRGSCIGGPAMGSGKYYHVQEYMEVNRFAGKTDFSVQDAASEKLAKAMPFEGKAQPRPGSAAIEEILRKMGKNSPEQELNCGSCGYNTCREKAAAVLSGKADLSMCLPYLKDKAESFSDKIISNTPNGIFVLNEQLEIQQMNTAAQKILNVKNQRDVAGESIMKLLDPTDYLLAMNEPKRREEVRKYLEQYDKYVDETILYDKEYNIVMSIMKDVTEEERIRMSKEDHSKKVVEITDKVVEKQMRVVQEIASLLGETTAETKIALTKLKETLADE